MKFFVPMIALIGVVIIMAGIGGSSEGVRAGRSILMVIGFVILLGLGFSLVVDRAL